MEVSDRGYLAVETMVLLATQDQDKPCTRAGLAKWINRPEPYLITLLAPLRNAGLVAPHPGPQPGYILARPADQITVADVFEAVDEPSAFANRALNSRTFDLQEALELRGTDRLWEKLERHVWLFLNDVSLADVASDAPKLVDGRFRHEDRVSPANMHSLVRY